MNKDVNDAERAGAARVILSRAWKQWPQFQQGLATLSQTPFLLGVLYDVASVLFEGEDSDGCKTMNGETEPHHPVEADPAVMADLWAKVDEMDTREFTAYARGLGVEPPVEPVFNGWKIVLSYPGDDWEHPILCWWGPEENHGEESEASLAFSDEDILPLERTSKEVIERECMNESAKHLIDQILQGLARDHDFIIERGSPGELVSSADENPMLVQFILDEEELHVSGSAEAIVEFTMLLGYVTGRHDQEGTLMPLLANLTENPRLERVGVEWVLVLPKFTLPAGS